MSRTSFFRLATVTVAAFGLSNFAAVWCHGAPPPAKPPSHTMPSKPAAKQPAVKQPAVQPHSTPQPKKHVNQSEPSHSAPGGRTPLYIPPIVIAPQTGPRYLPPQTTYAAPNLPNGAVSQPSLTPIPANQLPVTTVTALKPNALPQPPVNDLKPNFKPTVAAASYELVALAAEAIAAEQQAKLDDLIAGLGPEQMADPGVAAAIENIQNKIDNGELVTIEDLQGVEDAVVNAINNGVPAPGISPSEFGRLLGGIQTLSEVQQVASLFPSGGGTLPLPAGLVDVITAPFLPADQTYVLPSGAILDGTGGAVDPSNAAGAGGIAMGQGTLAESLGLPPGAGEPVPSSIADSKDRITSGLLIMNPASNAMDIAYVVNNASQSSQAGSNRLFPGTGTAVAQFNRGPGFGDAKYSLTEGSYFFASTNKGWELYNRTFSVTIDNAENRTAFEYVIDNKPATLPSGKSQTHTSKYPMLIRFDQGGGTQPAQKQIDDPTIAKLVLRVAVNTDTNLWDLYPAKNFDSVPMPVSETMLAAAPAPTASMVQFAPPPAKAKTSGKVKLVRADAVTPAREKLTSWPKPGKVVSPPAPVAEPDKK